MHKHKPSTFLSVIFLSLLKYKCLKFRVRKTLNQKEILRQNNLFLFNALYPSLNFLTELCTILLERLCCNYKTDCIISLEKITQVSSQWLFLFFSFGKQHIWQTPNLSPIMGELSYWANKLWHLFYQNLWCLFWKWHHTD